MAEKYRRPRQFEELIGDLLYMLLSTRQGRRHRTLASNETVSGKGMVRPTAMPHGILPEAMLRRLHEPTDERTAISAARRRSKDALIPIRSAVARSVEHVCGKPSSKQAMDPTRAAVGCSNEVSALTSSPMHQ